MPKPELIFGRVIDDRLARSRVCVLHGRDLLEPMGRKDPEYLAFQKAEGFSVQATCVYRTVSSAGVEIESRLPLPWINRRFTGGQPQWEMMRAQRFAIPDEVPAGDVTITYRRNDGATADLVVSVPPRVPPSAPTTPHKKGTLIVPAKTTLRGYDVDLSLSMQSEPALIFEPGGRLVDSRVRIPHGLAIGGDGFDGCGIEHTSIECHTLSVLTTRKPIGRSTLHAVEFVGLGGFHAGEFGWLTNGNRNLGERCTVRGFCRGPLELGDAGENLWCDWTLSDIGPHSNGESEGWLCECPQGEYPTKIEWLRADGSTAAAGERAMTLRCELRSRGWLAKVGTFVINKQSREVAEVVRVSGRTIPGDWELTLAKPIAQALPGQLRIGPAAVGNTWARCQMIRGKHLLSFAGPAIENHVIDCRSWQCVEPWSYNLAEPRPRVGWEPAMNESFGWSTSDNWRNVERFFGGTWVRPVYAQLGPPYAEGSRRIDPRAIWDTGYSGGIRHDGSFA